MYFSKTCQMNHQDCKDFSELEWKIKVQRHTNRLRSSNQATILNSKLIKDACEMLCTILVTRSSEQI